MLPVTEVPDDIYRICRHWCWPPAERDAYDPATPRKNPQFALVAYRETATADSSVDLPALRAEFVRLRDEPLYRTKMPTYYADFCRGADWCADRMAERRLKGAVRIANFDTTPSKETMEALRTVDLCLATAFLNARGIVVGGVAGSDSIH